MNYSKLYTAIIDRAVKLRGHPQKLHAYKPGLEIHHIRPVSSFPDGRADNDAHKPVNLSYLTLREHFLAHWLLARMYGGKMSLAFYMMCNRISYTSGRAYERHKIAGLKARNADPEYVRRNLAGAAKREASTTYRENRKKGVQRIMNTPHWKESHKAGLTKRLDDAAWVANLAAIQQDPKRRAAAGERLRMFNADPAYQARAEAALSLKRNTPEFRAALMAGVAKREATPGFKERRRAGTDRARTTSGFKEKHQAGIDKRASNTEWRKNSYEASQRRNKTVIGKHLVTGEVIRLHGKQQMLAAGFNNKGISACIRQPERNKSYKGYSWRLATSEDE